MSPADKVFPIRKDAPSEFGKTDSHSPIDDFREKRQNIHIAKSQKLRNPPMTDELTRSYIENARLEAKANSDLLEQKLDKIEQRFEMHTQNLEQRMEMHTQKIVEQNQLLSSRLDAHQNDIKEIRQDGKSTRTTIIVTGISIVLGLGALGYVFIQTLQSSQEAWLMKALDLIQKIPPQ